MTCPKCNKQIPDMSAYCLFCGKKVGDVETEKKKKPRGRRPGGAGTIWKIKGREKKPWAARIMISGDNHYLGTFATKLEAQLAIDKAVREPQALNVITVTVGEAKDLWLETHGPTVTKKAHEQYKSAWNYLKLLENMPLRNLRTDALQKIIDEMAKLGKARSTCEKVKQLASQICKWGLKNDVLSKNYAEFLTLPKGKNPDKTPFSDEELVKMWQIYEEKRDRRIGEILLMCYTGFRINEFLSLRKEDYYDGCLHGGSKTEKGRNRTVPVPEFVKPILEEMLKNESDLITPTPTGKEYDENNYRQRRFKKALKEYELPPLTPNSTRHTYATISVEAGMDKKALQDIIGHEKFETTANIYTHVDVKWLIEQSDKIKKPSILSTTIST